MGGDKTESSVWIICLIIYFLLHFFVIFFLKGSASDFGADDGTVTQSQDYSQNIKAASTSASALSLPIAIGSTLLFMFGFSSVMAIPALYMLLYSVFFTYIPLFMLIFAIRAELPV